MNNDIVTIHNGLLDTPGNKASYSRKEVTGYIEKSYIWEYVPKGKSGVTSIWVPDERTFFQLLKFWNHCSYGDWKYSDVCDTPQTKPSQEKPEAKKIEKTAGEIKSILRSYCQGYLIGDMSDLTEFFKKVQKLAKE